MNHIHSLYSCTIPGCTEYPMLVVTANIRDDSIAFKKKYTDQLGGTSVMVPMETGGAELATMLSVKYSGPSFWIEPNRHFTNIIAGGGFHDIMTDSLIDLHNMQAHEHTAITVPNTKKHSILPTPVISIIGTTIKISGISNKAQVEILRLNGQLLKKFTINSSCTEIVPELQNNALIVRIKQKEDIFSKVIILNQ